MGVHQQSPVKVVYLTLVDANMPGQLEKVPKQQNNYKNVSDYSKNVFV
jgi:hypothetical protein